MNSAEIQSQVHSMNIYVKVDARNYQGHRKNTEDYRFALAEVVNADCMGNPRQ